MHLKNFDTETFLHNSWQKKPQLIRNPWTKWHNPLEADELAGLACEEDIESRIIRQSGDGWDIEHGPFPDEHFSTLGAKQWTLLVQAVDHIVPEVAALIEPFRFIPNWRIDDVMVSYAADGGSVGPHYDQYDVFLIQGQGKRRWQVGQMCNEDSETLEHDELRLLANFEATDEWVLEAGDILYVPPGLAHNGVAVGDDCMTYSVGFRAPSRSELIAHYCDDVLDGLQDDDRYTDTEATLSKRENPGEISAEEIARLHAMILEKLQDRSAFTQWIGHYLSTPKYPDGHWQPDASIDSDEMQTMIAKGATLERNPASRFSFVRHNENALTLFVDGEAFDCTGEDAIFADLICNHDQIKLLPEHGHADGIIKLTVILHNHGRIAVSTED